MTTTPQTIEVKLLGQKFVLKSSECDPDWVREVVDLVSLRLDEAEKRGRGVAAHQVALLALMDLAEEYVKAKKRIFEYQKQVDEKANRLLGLLESELK